MLASPHLAVIGARTLAQQAPLVTDRSVKEPVNAAIALWAMVARVKSAASSLVIGICPFVIGCAGGDPSPASQDAGISGVLPTGAQYLVRSQPALDDIVEGVYGAIIFDLEAARIGADLRKRLKL